MPWPPDKAERRPSGEMGDAQEIALGGGDKNNIAAARIPAPRREAGVCWRCRTPIAWTTLETLRRCTELAKRERAS